MENSKPITTATSKDDSRLKVGIVKAAMRKKKDGKGGWIGDAAKSIGSAVSGAVSGIVKKTKNLADDYFDTSGQRQKSFDEYFGNQKQGGLKHYYDYSKHYRRIKRANQGKVPSNVNELITKEKD